MNWTAERPTEPGWYWYASPDYGPTPVYVEWTGFINRPDARQLEITMACGEDIDQPLVEISSLEGVWAGPMPMPQEAA